MTLSFISESQGGSFSAEVGQRLSGHWPTSLQTVRAITDRVCWSGRGLWPVNQTMSQDWRAVADSRDGACALGAPLMWCRICWMTSGSVISAMISNVPPHNGHIVGPDNRLHPLYILAATCLISERIQVRAGSWSVCSSQTIWIGSSPLPNSSGKSRLPRPSEPPSMLTTRSPSTAIISLTATILGATRKWGTSSGSAYEQWWLKLPFCVDSFQRCCNN